MSESSVGEPAPDFALRCVSAADTEPRPLRLSDYSGRWLVLVFYPRDFSFVCPTELTAFSAHLADFGARDCDLLGVSVDSIELHREWLTTPAAEGGLGPLRFPLASDPKGEAARAYGVWIEEKEVSTRGLFVVDPAGILQYSVIHNLSVGRRPDVVLRVLDALRTGGLCAANWTSADGTIDPERALQPGRILGHYRIRRRLGSGTFGTVFAAWDLRLERDVALKVLKRAIFESREAVLVEARTAAKLNHPHVCTIYAVDEEDGLPVIAMEYLAGRPLSQTLAGGLPRGSALRLAAQIASGLAAAHGQDVVHGDLKPANIMVTGEGTEKGTAKILDFGLAGSRQLSSAAEDDIEGADPLEATVDFAPSADTPAGIRGSPAYMSPEQASGSAATPASDVFSFGLTWFEMLTGSRALTEQSPVELLYRLEAPELATELAGRVDPPYRELLAAILARDPAERPAMAEAAQKIAAMAVG